MMATATQEVIKLVDRTTLGMQQSFLLHAPSYKEVGNTDLHSGIGAHLEQLKTQGLWPLRKSACS